MDGWDDDGWGEDAGTNESAQIEKMLGCLTPAQREAVEHVDGPLLVIAGPGSGKTRVITCRIARMISQGIRGDQILAITFTNKAAGEMRRRVQSLLPGKYVWISTFHSFGVRILRQYADRLGIDPNFTLYDQSDRLAIVKASIEAAGFDPVRFRPDSMQSRISKAKNELQLPADFAKKHHGNDYYSSVVAEVYTAYEKRMREQNAFDFDDLLLWPALALKNDQELRSDLDARFRYVLIDEYQDTNLAQYSVVRSLSKDHPNLCVVGDPDQSIYRWRGSDIRNILEFERDFPDATVVTLNENFRSTKSILAAADHLIAHNAGRKPKTMVTPNAVGAKVRVLQFENGAEEAIGLASQIKEEVEAGRRKYRDYAILMRLNALTRGLESAFLRMKVPFQIVRGLAFFERAENKDILAYLRVLLNPRDDLSFLRAVNEPARGVGKTSLEYLRDYAQPREIPLLEAAADVAKIDTIKGKAATGLRQFVALINDLRKNLDAPPHEVINAVLVESGYERALRKSDDPEDAQRLANVQELVSAARQFHAEDNQRTIAEFLESVTLTSDVDGLDETQDAVSMMTLHAAKGLEFPSVFLLAVEHGILPHERSLKNREEEEEERRLAFVGMTRAQESLSLTYCRNRDFRGQVMTVVPSGFLEQLPDEQVEWKNLTHSSGGVQRAFEQYRGGAGPTGQSWYDSGFRDTVKKPGLSTSTSPATSSTKSSVPALDVTLRSDGSAAGGANYAEGMMVMHDVYGAGKITDISGHGVLRKIRVRFSTGERTFIAEKAKLAIVRK